MIENNDFLARTRLLVGDDAVARISSRRVIVFGVGGVGSWCTESLVRSGITRLTLVDSDAVCVSNINRQLMATTRTVGQPKVEALRDRLMQINPSAEISVRRQVFCEETLPEFCFDDYDYVIDAIDSLKDKVLLIYKVCESRATLFSSMGAALKMDPSRIRVAEFNKVEGCPLARALRKRFKRIGSRPARKFLCVYSDELLPNLGNNAAEAIETTTFRKAQTNGTVAHITAIFGFTLAGLVIKDIVSQPYHK
ncbi:MAG: tRNA threonylcarbamoyladenosine dehydratase [Prevotella sp.]|uniref:tRNA threonylcarbamoyladenosine dehydratase n=1 Tax=Prevotella sp. TaxID=59823 RepID=UPI002A318CF7|nr:tRNA threonylcarbamoyladenosine dehydratase [Prevotella sp.]MDD7318416.1 tRNA threonylcarbamoyladenosine dehydratase [Prevotellaceae bacterium]MDY4020233.1 tRNA threonylcarbamoyladenosine dehydratase [Prevotella sp.]